MAKKELFIQPIIDGKPVKGIKPLNLNKFGNRRFPKEDPPDYSPMEEAHRIMENAMLRKENEELKKQISPREYAKKHGHYPPFKDKEKKGCKTCEHGYKVQGGGYNCNEKMLNGVPYVPMTFDCTGWTKKISKKAELKEREKIKAAIERAELQRLTEANKKQKIKNGRAEVAGSNMADSLIEFIHLMYQKNTAKRVLSALIARLELRTEEFK